MLFDRATFKTNAKASLRRFYGWALLATLIITVLGGANGAAGTNSNVNFSVSLPTSSFQSLTDSINEFQSTADHASIGAAAAEVGEAIDILAEEQASAPQTSFSEFISGEDGAVLLAISVFFLIAMAIAIVFQLFVSNPLEVGYRRFFLSARDESAKCRI